MTDTAATRPYGVLGRVLGNAVAGISFLSWMNMGVSAGLSPVTIDLAVLTVTRTAAAGAGL